MSSVWDGLAGHERLRSLLGAAAAQPGGAYLFAGPPGVGKVAAAHAFGAAVLCPEQCGECSICNRALSGVHPDVQWFQPEGTTYPVDEIRQIVGAAGRTPLEGSRRVMIIEEADRITERSQNALLKALEEPGPRLVWVLVAEMLDAFLPTVLSRCQVVDFAPVPEETVRRLIQSRFALGESEAAEIVQASRGDLDRAVELAGDERAGTVRRMALESATAGDRSPRFALVTAERIREVAAGVRADLEAEQKAELEAVGEVSGPGWSRRVGERHRRALRAAETRVFDDFLFWFGAALSDLAAASGGADPSEVSALDWADEIASAAGTHPPGFWLEMAEVVLEARMALKENANASLVVEEVLLRRAGTAAAAG